MKLFKKTIIFIFALVTFGMNAQEKKEQRAKELTEKFGEKLGDQKLSADQVSKIELIFAEKLKEIKNLKTEGLSEEDKKAKTKEINKSYTKKIHALLTKEQKEMLKKQKSE